MELDVRIDFDSDISFSRFEHFFGQVVASPHAIEKTAESLLPLILNCSKTEIERQISNVIFNQIPPLAEALLTGQLQDVIIQHIVGSIAFVVCTPPNFVRRPEQPEGGVIG